MNDSLPASIGARRPSAPAPEAEPALLRLHAALGELDAAIFNALRALDVALGREITRAPESNLPIRELGRLRDQLQQARGETRGAPRPSFAELAIRTDGES